MSRQGAGSGEPCPHLLTRHLTPPHRLPQQYAEEEAARKKKEEMSQSDVQKAQQRVARDSVRHLKDFSWN